MDRLARERDQAVSEIGQRMQTAPLGVGEDERAARVRAMFGEIAGRYDLLNHIMSFRLHRFWRRRAVALAGVRTGDTVLDVCTGTGDFALDLHRAVGSTGYVVGCDFCAPMLRLGKAKADAASGGRICMVGADALRLPYASDTFSCATVGFGIRNVANADVAIREMARVVRTGGRVAILEFNSPRNPLVCALVRAYERFVLPLMGGMLSRREAYSYLQHSIRVFYTREELSAIMASAGLVDVRVFDFNFGSVCLHLGTKA